MEVLEQTVTVFCFAVLVYYDQTLLCREVLAAICARVLESRYDRCILWGFHTVGVFAVPIL
jgi:hypothetical protein